VRRSTRGGRERPKPGQEVAGGWVWCADALVCRPAASTSTSTPEVAVTYPEQASEDLLLSCTTFNVLAPIYKRLGGGRM